MHYLLIQQAIMDEVLKQAYAQGNKALAEYKVEGFQINAALNRMEISDEDIDKWLAALHLEEYVVLTAEDHTRNPFYITPTKKGVLASHAKHFEEKYKEKCKVDTKDYIQIGYQFALGVIAILAFLSATGKSCNKLTIQQIQAQPEARGSAIVETKSFPTLQPSKFYSLSIDAWLDTKSLILVS